MRSTPGLLGLAPLLLLLGAQAPRPEQTPRATPRPVAFPAAWHGTWAGTCRNLLPGGKVRMRFPMVLVVAPTGDPLRTAWTIIYGEGERRQVRAYELLTVDAAKGHYRIDEKNSIVLDAWWCDGVLYQHFRVDRSVLHVRFTRRGKSLAVEMATWDHRSARSTGGKGRVPKVQSLAMRAVQVGTLERIPALSQPGREKRPGR